MFSYRIHEPSLDIEILFYGKVVDLVSHSLEDIEEIKKWAQKYVDKKNNPS